MTCAGLLIAAPIALLVSGGADGGGPTSDPDGVFTGGPGTGTGGGGGRGGAGITPESFEAPAPGLPPVDGAADAGAVGGTGSGAADGGTAAGAAGANGGSGTQPGSRAAPAGTAAGRPGSGGSSGGTNADSPSAPATGSNPASANPPPGEDPCPCKKVGETVGTVTDPLEDAVNNTTGTLDGVTGGALP